MIHFFSFRQKMRRSDTNFRHQLVVGLGILTTMMLHSLCQMQTVAFVEVRPSLSSPSRPCSSFHRPLGSKSRSSIHGSIIYSEKNFNARAAAAAGSNNVRYNSNDENKTKEDLKHRRKPRNNNNYHQQQYQPTSNSSPHLVTKKLDAIRSPAEIEDWIAGQLRQQQQHDDPKRQNNNNYNNSTSAVSSWAKWSIYEQVEFVKYLQRRRAFASILSFLSVLDFDSTKKEEDTTTTTSQYNKKKQQHRLVKVYTTALFAIASSIDPDRDHHRDRNNNRVVDTKGMTMEILDRMQRNHVPATTLTYVAIFKNLQGRPADVIQMIRFLEKNELHLPKTERITWDAEVYHAAMYACGSQTHRSRRTSTTNNRGISSNRSSPTDSNNNNDWQTSLSLMQHMQRKGIQPTSKTYLAVLDVMAQNQAKVPIIKSIIRQWKNARVAGRCDGDQEDRIWATALNACAVVGDVCQALQFVEEMSETCKPNLRHCTAILKSFARAKGGGRDRLATTALDAMMGNKTAVLEVQDGKNSNKQYRVLLPPTDLDLVALNTVLSIVVKAGSFDDAQQIFQRIQGGEFKDSSGTVLSPDRITYHNLLVGCRDPEFAKKVVKEMRLSRRNRHGAIPPNSVTYAHAISVCQRATMPDLRIVNQLMDWSNDDQVKPTVFMYASAIWTAQRCGDLSRCLELYNELERNGCKPNGVVLNGLISALCDNGSHMRAMGVFHLLKNRGFQVSSVALKRLVFATLQSNKFQFTDEKKEQILLEIVSRLDDDEREVNISSPVFEALISIYAARGDVDKALTVMDQISGCPDAACFRAILLAYSSCPQSGWSESVELLHTTIIVESPAPGSVDQIALSHVLMACSRANEFEEGLSLLNLYGLPTEKLPQGFPQISIVALNALIAACGRGGRPDLSLSLLNEISSRYGLRPDSRSYRSAIIACNQAQHLQKEYEAENGLKGDQSRDYDGTGEPFVEWWECSLALYRRMTEEGLTPDAQTHSSIISSCEAAGEWQRALGVLQTIIDNSKDTPSSLNMYCWNAALSACEKGGAWVEALDLYERMLESPFKPNVVTINSIMEALDKADQKELAQTIYDEGLDLGLLDPWKTTQNEEGESIVALDLHTFSESMAKAAIRKTMDTWLDEKDSTGGLNGDFVIITGKGKHSTSHPVLQKATKKVLLEYGIEADVDKSNRGRIVVCMRDLLDCFDNKSWS
jgi:pentatricopeptide repeat protein